MKLRNPLVRIGHLFRRDADEDVRARTRSADGHPLVPTVRIELDRERTLRFTMRESLRFKEMTGLSFFKGGVRLMDLDEDEFLSLVVACCEHEDPTVTKETILDYVYSDGITDVLAAVSILLAEFMPPAPEVADDPLVQAAVSRLTSRASGLLQSRQ